MIKLSDYVFSFIAGLGVKHVFLISGGGIMHLADSLGRNKDIEYICPLHEQAVAMATEGYARTKNDFGVALVTTGPGGTNAITGLAGAWISSAPCIFISGQVKLEDTIGNKQIRQFGIQEISIIDIVRPITKYAVMITDPSTIKYHLQKAVYIAKSGRPGPVWIDIPLDIQGAIIDENKLISLDSSELEENFDRNLLKTKVSECLEMIKRSRRPIILAGNGVILAGAQKEFIQLIEKLKIPFLTTWGAADLVDNAHSLYIGRPGLMGQRGANFAIQNSDLLLCIGTRLFVAHTGYNVKAFAREAKKIVVDIDKRELEKGNVKIDLPINFDAKEFIKEMISQTADYSFKDNDNWIDTCRNWRARYPVVLPEYFNQKSSVNSYVFIDMLSDELDNTDVIVTDMGTAKNCTMQTFKVKKGQRFFTSSGLASMGFGLPGSIGACLANDKKRTICISGDGGLQMNIQELQTFVYYNLPIKLFVISNQGYLTIRITQGAMFGGFYVGADESSGVSFPDIIKVAKAYGLKTEKITTHDGMRDKIRWVLNTSGPVVCEVVMAKNQLLAPKLKSKLHKDGTMASSPLEDMFPFLDREEFKKNMIIKPIEE